MLHYQMTIKQTKRQTDKQKTKKKKQRKIVKCFTIKCIEKQSMKQTNKPTDK